MWAIYKRAVAVAAIGLSVSASSLAVLKPELPRARPDRAHAPKIYSYTGTAGAGETIGILGADFDATTDAYLQQGGKQRKLTTVGRGLGAWLAVRLPAQVSPPLTVRLASRNGVSPAIAINAARPQMMDADEITPGGRFRILGRNLVALGRSPKVVIAGKLASIDLPASNENVLSIIAPAELKARANADVLVSNGDGSESTPLPGGARIASFVGPDTLGLGVGWGAVFDFAKRITRSEAKCDGIADDSAVISREIESAAASGGATVQLPTGTCNLAGTINFESKVVLRGAGQTKTILLYSGNYPISAEAKDSIGLEQMELQNAGPAEEGPVWRSNTHSFIRDVTLTIKKSRQLFLTNNSDFVFSRNIVSQSGSYDLQNPYRFDSSSGLIFSDNVSNNRDGSPTFQGVHDAVFINNHFTRNAASQFESEIVAHHSFAFDFAYRVAVIGNTFDVANGPITNVDRNDGEAMLVEGGGPTRTEASGVVDTATARTLTDPNTTIKSPDGGTKLPDNLAVVILTGAGAGQIRRVASISNHTLTVDKDWDVAPQHGATFSTFVWGLESAIIAHNHFRDNPRGIWLYQCSVRDVLISDNDFENGGGIFLRSYQNLQNKMFTLQSDISIIDNKIRNDTGRWLSYITLATVSTDPLTAGVAQQNIDIRRNIVSANAPNAASTKEDYANGEGFWSKVGRETTDTRRDNRPFAMGLIWEKNTCIGCQTPFVIAKEVAGVLSVENRSPTKAEIAH